MILWQLGFPIVSVLLFVYVFGSAMEVGGGADYTTYAMPGMFAMTMAFGFMNTAYIMVVDKEKGVTDRFRSMPMARSAVVSGRGVGDLIGAAIDLAVLALIARRGRLAVRGRPAGHGVRVLPAAAAAVLADLDRRLPRDVRARARSRPATCSPIAFPFGMLSSVFTPPSLMPDWLGFIAMWNPVSSTANAIRELFGNPVPTGDSWIEQHAMEMALVWPLLITAAFLPLAVRKYQRLSK